MSASGLPRATLRVVAIAAFSLAASSPLVELAAISALAGLLLFIWSTRGGRPDNDPRLAIWASSAALVVIAASWLFTPGPAAPSEESIRPVYQGLLIAALLLTLVRGRSITARRVAVGLSMSGVVLASAWILVNEWDSPVGTDVYLAHSAAGDALFEGENPYGDSVRFPDGSPFEPPGAVVVGYPYPPVVLVSHGVMAELADTRVISIVAWLALLSVLAKSALVRREEGEIGFSVFLILAATPIWPVILYGSWTEPLSLLLLLGAFVSWRGKPRWSAVLLGVALASKQYFVLLLPLLLLMRVDKRVERITIAGAAACAVLVPPLFIEPAAYVSATIETLLNIGFRPDTQSLPGLLAASGIEFMPSRWLWIIGIGVVGAVIGYGTRSLTGLTRGFVLVLGIAFWTGLAFANYWFLVMSLAGISVYVSRGALEDPDGSEPGPDVVAAYR